MLLCIGFPAFFALLISEKRFYYLITIVPLFAICIAWAVADTSIPSRFNWVILAIFAAGIIQGSLGIIEMHQQAGQAIQPAAFLINFNHISLLKEIFLDLKLIGWHFRTGSIAQSGWLDFCRAQKARSLQLSLKRSNKSAPEILIVQPIWMSWISPGNETAGRAAFVTYLDAWNAVLLGRLIDYEGIPIEIYQVERQSIESSSNHRLPPLIQQIFGLMETAR